MLVTGFDIIFFWVARMMMMGLHLTGEVPFRDVLIHGLVRDERGQKMSKTKGNVVDPLELADRYGADALRLALLASATPGRDVRFGEQRVEGYRNFVTKLWNAARFLELNQCRLDPDFDPASPQQPLNRWIIGSVVRLESDVTQALEAFRLNDAALLLYRFTWDRFCDWYIELAKPLLAGGDGPEARETRATAAWTLSVLLRLLHPIAPFVTEELWARLFAAPGGMLIATAWPELPADLEDGEAEAELDWLIRLIGGVRTARAELNVPASARLTLHVQGAAPATLRRLDRHREAIFRLARIADYAPPEAPPLGAAIVTVVDEASFALPVGEVLDIDAERARLTKDIAKAQAELDRLELRLGNQDFVARAPEDVVLEQRARCAELASLIEKLALARSRIA